MNLRSPAVSLFFAGCVGLHGCAIHLHHGILVTEPQASSFAIGTATPDDVVKALGAPSWSAARPNGEKVIVYSQSTSRINPPSLAVLTGSSPGSEHLEINSTFFVFDKNLKLVRVERPKPSGTLGADK